jgi:nitrite reductase/ring-hydroxylating ferredoxin subunit
MTNSAPGRSRYRDDPEALRALVRDDAVHRDVYVDAEVFELERERPWARSWVYVGHESQVPTAGDCTTLDVAGRPLLMVRDESGAVRVLMNRCAHKRAKLVSDGSTNVGRFFRCLYHAWAYDLDGAVRAIPLRSGYEGTALASSDAARGLSPPLMMPTTPVVPMPRWMGMPQAVSCCATTSAVRCSWKHNSGWAWMSRRTAARLWAWARISSMTFIQGSHLRLGVGQSIELAQL